MAHRMVLLLVSAVPASGEIPSGSPRYWPQYGGAREVTLERAGGREDAAHRVEFRVAAVNEAVLPGAADHRELQSAMQDTRPQDPDVTPSLGFCGSEWKPTSELGLCSRRSSALVPTAMLIGSQKCATTSLHRHLLRVYPELRGCGVASRRTGKILAERHFFDYAVNFAGVRPAQQCAAYLQCVKKDDAWPYTTWPYSNQSWVEGNSCSGDKPWSAPTSGLQRSNARSVGLDYTPDYLAEAAPARILHLYGEVLSKQLRFVVMLRRPSERVRSYFSHFRPMLDINEWVPLELQAVNDAQGCDSHLSSSPICASAYVIHLRRWQGVFDASQFLILSMDDYLQRTGQTLAAVGGHLGIAAIERQRVIARSEPDPLHLNTGEHKPGYDTPGANDEMSDESRALLDAFFAPYDKELAGFLAPNRTAHWQAFWLTDTMRSGTTPCANVACGSGFIWWQTRSSMALAVSSVVAIGLWAVWARCRHANGTNTPSSRVSQTIACPQAPIPMPVSLLPSNFARWAVYMCGLVVAILTYISVFASDFVQVNAHTIMVFSLTFALTGLPISLLAFYDFPQSVDTDGWTNDPSFLAKIALVIPCHQSAAEFGPILQSHLALFHPWQIIVVDNADSETPPDGLEALVRDIHPDVKYVYVPEGRKSQALHVGVSIMEGYEYVLLVDDDTSFPRVMVLDENHFLADEDCCGISYPRSIVEHNWLTRIIAFDLRYDAGQFRSGVVHALSGATHIAVGTTVLYRRDYWLDIMVDHPCTPYGEDTFATSLAISKGYRVAVEMRSSTHTFSPPILTALCYGFERDQGYGAATLWKQRALRWNCTGMRNTPFWIKNLWRFNGKTFFHRTAFRLNLVRLLISNAARLLAPWLVAYSIVGGVSPTSILYASPDGSGAAHLSGWMALLHTTMITFVVNYYRCIMVNYLLWWNNHEHRASLATVLLTPFVEAFLMVCSVVGGYKCLLVDVRDEKYRWRVGCWRRFQYLVEAKKVEYGMLPDGSATKTPFHSQDGVAPHRRLLLEPAAPAKGEVAAILL